MIKIPTKEEECQKYHIFAGTMTDKVYVGKLKQLESGNNLATVKVDRTQEFFKALFDLYKGFTWKVNDKDNKTYICCVLDQDELIEKHGNKTIIEFFELEKKKNYKS